jgi:hypothetical protein
MDHTTGTIELEIFGPYGFNETIAATGPTDVKRKTGPYDPGDGRWKIDTEIVFMNLTGVSMYIGPIAVVESPSKASNGAVQQLDPSDHSSANSYFDVYFEINTGFGAFHNDMPKTMSAIIHDIPPWEAIYLSAPGPSIELKNETEDTIGLIKGASHKIPPSPPVGGITFSVDRPRSLTQYIGLASTFIVATAATAICLKRIKRRKQDQ